MRRRHYTPREPKIIGIADGEDVRPRLHWAKGLCHICNDRVERLELWITRPYTARETQHGNPYKIKGGAFARAFCHGAIDERNIEYNLARAVVQKWREHLPEPFFNPAQKPYMPSHDKTGYSKSIEKPADTRTQEQIEYERYFDPKPQPRKRSPQHELEDRRNSQLERVPFYARQGNGKTD